MAKKQEVDPMETTYNKVDRLSKTYSNDPYWQALKIGCDDIRKGKTTQTTIDTVDKEYRNWGPLMPNKAILATIKEKLNSLQENA